MLARLTRLRKDEQGMSFVFVGMGFLAFMTATTLVIDVGMFMTARSQAQNAADAGALSGAEALVFNSFTDRTASGPAVQSAISAAQKNLVMSGQPSVLPADVTFPNDPTGQPTRVRVQVFRTSARGNPIPTLMGAMFGISTVNIGADATAEASPANAETCVKPFTIPDKWEEHQTGAWDPSDTFDMYDDKGNPIANPDVYRGPSDPNPTGYNYQTDTGREIVLKANNDLKITASFYNPYDLPGSVGASDYRSNIDNCNPAKMGDGDAVPPENGNMEGPTKQGTQGLVDRDPGAYWDQTCNCVQGSDPRTWTNGHSPRVVVIPVYDPTVFADGAAHGKNISLKIVNFVGFFIEPMTGGEVTGRITPIGGVFDGNRGPAPPGAFPRVIRLVQ